MVLILKSWTQAVSFAVYLLLALPTEAHPQPKRKNQAKTGKGAATGGAGAGGATAGAAKITAATDGSMILDKTVNIG